MTIRVGSGGGGGGPAPRPARPAYHPPPSVPIRTLVNPVTPYHAPSGGISHAISGAVHGVSHALAPVARAAPRPAVRQAVRQASRPAPQPNPIRALVNPTAQFKVTPAYTQALVHIFRAQPPEGKAAIIRGITISNSFDTPEYRAIRPQWDHLSIPERSAISSLIPKDLPKFIAPKPGPDIFGGLGKILSPSNVYGSGKAGSTQGGGSLAGVALFGGQQGAKQLLGNAGKDLVNLPAETVSTVGTLGGDVLQGKPGKAVSDFVGPYKQLVEHPAAMFAAHPLLSTLMATGAIHGAARAAAGPVRALADPASVAGRAVSTQREGVALTGNLTHERPPFSRSPTVKAQQFAFDAKRYRRAADGRLVPRSEQLRKRLLNQEIGQVVGVRERIRRVNQQQVKVVREQAITSSSRAKRGAMKAAHQVKTMLKYDPKAPAIPGAQVLARIADTTIRRPDTIVPDIQKHLAQVSANRPNLLDDKAGLAFHDAYVKQLQAATKDKAFLKNPGPAFKAAEAFRKDLAPVEAKAAKLGHFGNMTQDMLQRRALEHYAVTHMGAHMGPELGLVDHTGSPLPNSRVLAHLKSAQGTGGRLPAYTPDRVRFDREQAAREAHYPGPRRPLPAVKKNTLYAYTHGLTDPSHLALTEHHLLMQGVVDAHNTHNTLLETLHMQMPGGGYAKTFQDAKDRLRNTGLKPINIAQPFHPQESLSQATEDVNPATAEEEILRRGLDLSSRTHPTAGEGRWAAIDPHALKALQKHQNQISPNELMRTIRGLNNQFRTVALATSAKHIPGVAQENLIRDIGAGVGFRSWLTGRRILSKAEQLNPERGKEIRTSLTGGQVAGMTEAGKTYRVSDHWSGTSAYPFLRAFEVASKAPGPRQLTSAWKAWTTLAIHGTKLVLEQQHQIAGLGKAALVEHGYAEAARTQGFLGLFHRALSLHGQMLEDAAKGLFDPAKQRQTRALINQMYGKWTDLSPSAQTALMFSPFGLWWINSAKYLARMPVDQPVKTGLLASATAGTQQERQAHGLDMFMQGALPAYEQGGIPVGGKIIAQNYYSPFGIANDPLATGQSLVQPWLTPFVAGSLGVNWLGKPLSSPSNPKGRTPANNLHKVQYILDSALSSFVPLYTKAKQVAEGGASSYDTTDNGLIPFPPVTKTPGQGAGVGLKKAVQPFRSYKAVTPGAPTSASSASGGWGGSTSTSGSSSSGWGGSSKATGGWGG